MRPFLGAHDRIVADDADINILVLSDSRAHGTTGFQGPSYWAARLGSTYPTFTVKHQNWNDTAGSWDSETTVSTGSGSNTIKIFNGSWGGTEWDYQVTNEADILQYPSSVDHILIADDYTASVSLATYLDLCQLRHPNAYITYCVVNPRIGFEMAPYIATIKSVCADYGVGVVDIYEAFYAYGDWESDLMYDSVHPNTDGYDVWVDALMLAIARSSARMGGILNRAELLLQAKNYAGSGDWSDESGNGHNATNSGALFLAFTGLPYCYFPGTAGNTVTVAGLSNSTTYDYTLTYDDGTTDTGSGTTDGSGNLVMGATDAKFAGLKVRSIVIVPDGGGATVETVSFADASEPFATFTGATAGKTITIQRSASGLVSTVVDRDMFLLTTDDYFTIADDDGLDFTAGQNMTVIAVARLAHTGTDFQILANKGYVSASLPSWSFGIDSSERTWFQTVSVSNVDIDFDSTAIDTNTLYPLAGVRTAASTNETFLNGAGSGGTASDNTDLSNTRAMLIGAWNNGAGVKQKFWEGQIVAVALFREALTDNEIYLVGRSLVKQVDDPQDLHGDALKTWIMENDSNWTSTSSLELVGLLNELNGTSGKGYAEARATYLSVDPAG